MDWKTLLAYIILRNHITGHVRLRDGERKALAAIGHKLGKQASRTWPPS